MILTQKMLDRVQEPDVRSAMIKKEIDVRGKSEYTDSK